MGRLRLWNPRGGGGHQDWKLSSAQGHTRLFSLPEVEPEGPGLMVLGAGPSGTMFGALSIIHPIHVSYPGILQVSM